MPTGPQAPSARPTGARRPARRTTALAVLVALLLAPLTALGLASPAAAATVRAFTPVFSANTNGDILMAANTLMTCRATSPGTNFANCATARASTFNAAYSNNDFTAEHVNDDADATTFNASSATLTVPADGTVLFAALVWGGRTETFNATSSNSALRGNVKLKVPGAPGYRDLTATQVDVNTADNGYQSYLDVTGIVATAGSGLYTVANVQSTTGTTDDYAGWSLVVAVSDPEAPARNLTVFTGFGSVASGNGMPTFTVSGFLTPPSGPVRTTLGAVTYEGDMGLTGDAFRLNSTTISDALNPATNPFNSSISRHGVAVPGRSPSYGNQLGFDADLFKADGILPNGATSANLTLTTGGETFYPGVVTFATDLYDPKLLGVKSVEDVNGGLVEPGDVLRYTVPVQNIGLDTASDSRFFDAIPTGTTYVPGSLVVDTVAQTDAAGDGDVGHYDGSQNGHVIVYLGSGASSAHGGDVPVSPSGSTAQHTVVFDVRVNADARDTQKIVNSAAMTYRGATTYAAAASASNVLLNPVVTTPLPGPNRPPVAQPHVLTFTPTPSQRRLDIDVLANDSDPDGDVLTVVAVTDTAGGTAEILPGGQIRYTPRDDFAGRDVFTYTIQDPGGYRATTSVQIEVLNTPPNAVADTATTRGATPVDVDVLVNDTDPNGDTLRLRSAGPSSANGGTVTVRDGDTVTYTPRTGFKGTDTFEYVVEDSRGLTDTAVVTVTVTNNAPVAVADSYTVNTGTSRSIAVLGNDTDADGDTLSAVLVSGPSHGTLTLNANGTGTYTSNGAYRGTDSFTYRVSDGTAQSNVVTVTLTVNGAPTAGDDTATVAAGQTSVDVDVLANDADVEGDLTVTVTGAPAHGTTAVQADGTVRYTPSTGWAGTDRFTYTVTDEGGLTDTAEVVVTVANTPPVAVDDTASTATDTSASHVAVLANDTDVNVTAGVAGQSLRIVTASADRGTVDVETDDTLTVHPPTGFSGVVVVTYTVGDGAGGTDVGELRVTVANGSPSAVADGPVTTPTDRSVLVDVLDNDTDPNTADVLSIVPGSVAAPRDGDGTTRGTAVIENGEIRYTPPTGWAGTVTFTYDVTDGDATATGTVTVTVANAAPVAVDDTASTASGTPVTVDVLGDDTDANIPGTAQVLGVTGATADNSATVVVETDGRLTVTPAPGFAGDVTVTYTVSDGAGGTDTGTLVVTVANAAPVAPPATGTTPYATPVELDLLDGVTDANGDPLTVTVGTPTDAGGTTRGTVTVTHGVATYTPPAGFSGTVTFTYTVDDGTDTTTATVTVVVGNAAPVVTTPPAGGGTKVRTSPGSAVTIDVLADVTDPDGGTVTVVDVTQPSSGTVTIVDGRLVYTPVPGFTGTVTFTYTVVDDQGARTTGTVTVEVLGGQAALATTGADVARVAGAALLLLALGGLMLAVRRRRTGVTA